MSVRRRAIVAVLLALLPLCGIAQAQEKTPADVTLTRRGTLPIILSAPHGGRESLPGVKPRDPDNKTKPAYAHYGGFVLGGDTNTDVMAQAIAAEINRLTGQAPYLVVAKFARRYIDANRPAALALDDPKAQPIYDHYHRSIGDFIDDLRRRHPSGLLIDVHAQNKDPEVVMRGTHNGRAVWRLLQRAGYPAVTGPRGLFGQLEAKGFKVYPSNRIPPAGTSEDGGYNGGYTVALYGRQRRNGIDSVQLEFGSRYCRTAVVQDHAKAAAAAIVGFYQAYLSAAGK